VLALLEFCQRVLGLAGPRALLDPHVELEFFQFFVPSVVDVVVDLAVFVDERKSSLDASAGVVADVHVELPELAIGKLR
jgi:hypothetical protein